jgi:hypothetical protein
MYCFLIFVLLILSNAPSFGQDEICLSSGPVESFVKDLITPIHCPDCKDVKIQCKLSQIADLPELIFIGEEHSNPNSIAIKKELFELAERGEILLVTEVSQNSPALSSARSSYLSAFNPGADSKNVYGIESELPTAIINSYKIQNSLMESGPTGDLFSELVQGTVLFSIFREALEEVRREKSFATSVQSADLLMKWLEKVAKSKSINVKESIEIRKKLSQTEIPKEFFSAIHRKIIDIAKRESSDRLLGIKLPYYLKREDSVVIGLKPGINSEFDSTKILAKLLIDVRNRDFSESIGNVICQNAGKVRRIVVLLGDAHIMEVKRFLTGLSGGAIRTREFKSFNLDQNENLRATISRTLSKN